MNTGTRADYGFGIKTSVIILHRVTFPQNPVTRAAVARLE
jgi:hypothetical protein